MEDRQMPTPKDQQDGEDPVRSEEDYDIENIPGSWNCVDCGVNTAPGLMNRAETAAAINAAKDRGEDHVRIEDTYDANTEVYIVREAIWKRAGMEPWGGCLCVGCLEKRLGRRLKSKDFLGDHALLKLPGTPRLLSRQKRRPRIEG
jgi:hypothetical protein